MITAADEDLEKRLEFPPALVIETRYIDLWGDDEIISVQYMVDNLDYDDSKVMGVLKFRIRKKYIGEEEKDLDKLFFDKTETIELLSRNSRRNLKSTLDKYANIFAIKYNSDRNDDEYLPAKVFLDLSSMLDMSLNFYHERYIRDNYD